MMSCIILKKMQFKNIGILRMTGEVTDIFDKITLFGMTLFWQKQLNSLQNL